MSSLIEELQRDALNESVSVTELLRKCLVVATKLGVEEFAVWARRELDGYKDIEVPEYRVVRGQPEASNPYHGSQPISFENTKHAENFSKMNFTQPIGELEFDLKHAEKSGPGSFKASYSPAIENMLIKAIGFQLQPFLHVSSSQFQKILDAVRKIVLEWSLKLESDGIIGEGLSFSREEKEKAQSVTYNIKNYFRGDIDRSQIQIENAESAQTQSCVDISIPQLQEVVRSLKSSIEELALGSEAKDELLAEIQTLESQSNSPKPKDSILRESLGSVRRILEGASSNLVASGLLSQIGSLFGA